jgi:hypothetical protein
MKRSFSIMILVLSAAVVFVSCGGGGGGVPAAQTSVKLARTGQIVSYGTGSVVSAPTVTAGDDGALQRGVAWPNPRFSVASSGTGTVVTDNLTGLMWAGDPTLSTLCSNGTTTDWQGALNYVACLNTNNYLSHNDWRLPNRKELRSLANYGQSNVAAWLSTQGFSNVQAFHYWSSTTYAGGTAAAWIVYMGDGGVGALDKTFSTYVWPVRSGQ